MLQSTAPFPEIGCHALILVDPDDPLRNRGDRVTSVQATAYVAARVLRYTADQRHSPGEPVRYATVSIPGIEGASGQRTLPASLLRDATPLTADERRELADLAGRLTGKARASRKLVARHDDLAQRAELAPVLARQLRAAERETERRARPAAHEPEFA